MDVFIFVGTSFRGFIKNSIIVGSAISGHGIFFIIGYEFVDQNFERKPWQLAPHEKLSHPQLLTYGHINPLHIMYVNSLKHCVNLTFACLVNRQLTRMDKCFLINAVIFNLSDHVMTLNGKNNFLSIVWICLALTAISANPDCKEFRIQTTWLVEILNLLPFEGKPIKKPIMKTQNGVYWKWYKISQESGTHS